MNATSIDPRIEYVTRLQDAWQAPPDAWRDVPEPKVEGSKREEHSVKLLDAWLGPDGSKTASVDPRTAYADDLTNAWKRRGGTR